MNWLIVGCGSIGRRYLDILTKMLGEDHVAVVEPDEARRAEVKDQVRGRVTDTLADGLARGQPDVALVCSPTTCHVDDALACLAAGVPAIIEKPVAHTLERRAELEAAAVAPDGTHLAAVGCNFRFHVGLLHLKRQLAEGVAGRVLSLRASYGQALETWREGDYRTTYSAHRAQGGGLLLDRCHELDYLRWLFGEPSSIWATTAKASDLETDVEDVVEAVLNYNGLTVALHLDMLNRVYDCGLFALCERGNLPWDAMPQLSPLEPPVSWAVELSYIEQVRHWQRWLRGEEPPAQTVADAYRVVETALAGYESDRLGGVVTLPYAPADIPTGTVLPLTPQEAAVLDRITAEMAVRREDAQRAIAAARSGNTKRG